MAKPLYHARSIAKDLTGSSSNYHYFFQLNHLMDTSKSAHPKMSHRCVFHSDYGIELVQCLLGEYITDNDNILCTTKEAAIHHTIEDLGFVPTLDDYDKAMERAHVVDSIMAMRNRPLLPEDVVMSRLARKYNCKESDLNIINQMFDVPDSMTFRAIFYSSFGCFLFEELFGHYVMVNGRPVSTREIAEKVILMNYRKIPTLSDWLEGVDAPWMAGTTKLVQKTFVLVD